MFRINDNFKLITIDQLYIHSLYTACNEVFYMPTAYENKPYIGILISDNGRDYAIPLTSAKEKHKLWRNVNNGKILIFENTDASNLSSGSIYTFNSDGTAKHILSVIYICKMIPLKEGTYNIIDINPNSADSSEMRKYKSLLNKEYSFCVTNREKILKEANRIYQRQINTGKVFPGYCDFKKLEIACDRF